MSPTIVVPLILPFSVGPNLGPADHPLERLDPPAELILRDHEDLKIGRPPLEELATELLEPGVDRLLVSHALRDDPAAGPSLRRGGR